MTNKLIYIADDEVNIRNIIHSFLEKEGYIVKSFSDGTTILEAFHKAQPDLLILDIMMPGIDGFSLCEKIRVTSNIPIIIVSAKDTESDKIKGLNLGSDDYLTKPFSPTELVARIKSLFRRLDQTIQPLSTPTVVMLYDIELNENTKLAQFKGQSINFTGMEFSLLLYLGKNCNRAVSRGELLDKVWGFESAVETRATDDMIKRIRKKLNEVGSQLVIETVWGFGFRINESSSN